MEIKCPHCEKIQKQKPKKTWGYGTMVETKIKKEVVLNPSINCSYYFCKCGKSFNFYLTSKGNHWTIPKRETVQLRIELKKTQ